jgi:phospholipid transport system substrate-binding protein
MIQKRYIFAIHNPIICYGKEKLVLLFLYAIIFIIGFCLIFPSEVKADTPDQVVEKFHNELLAVMKDADSLGYAGRYEKLEKVIPEIFDFQLISRMVVGRYWETFTQEEKKRFLDLFTRLSIATYANRLDGYSGEKFNIISTKEFRNERKMVESNLVLPSGEKIEMIYILHQKNNMWMIINVIAEKVSDLALKRADFTAFLNRNSTGAFFDELIKKISELSDEGIDPIGFKL